MLPCIYLKLVEFVNLVLIGIFRSKTELDSVDVTLNWNEIKFESMLEERGTSIIKGDFKSNLI